MSNPTLWTPQGTTPTAYNPENYAPGEFFLLVEDGGYLLQETGDKIYLENYLHTGTLWTPE